MKRLLLGGLMVVAAGAAQGQVLECEDQTIRLDQLAPIWWDVDKPGMGVTLTYRDGGLWGYWTFYDRDSSPTWYLIVSDTVECRTWVKLYEFAGDHPFDLGRAYDPELLSATEVAGSHQIGFNSQNSIFFRFRVGLPYPTSDVERFNLVPF